jgi:aspartokinase-like uncharacterized kinase
MTGTIVIKVGGSLFDWPELPGQLNAVLDSHRAAYQRLVLLPGGGPAANFIRAIDKKFILGDLSAHRLALRSLDLTAHVLAALVPGLEVVDDLASLDQVWRRLRIPVLAPRRFFDESEGEASDPLPASWNVTSDSIAARVAVHLGATELVLLKSASLPPDTDRRAAADLGLVDPFFPDVSRSLRCVRHVNLRDGQREGRVFV